MDDDRMFIIFATTKVLLMSLWGYLCDRNKKYKLKYFMSISGVFVAFGLFLLGASNTMGIHLNM